MSKKPQPTELVFPWDTENFKDAWQLWKTWRWETHKFKYKTITSEQTAINHLSTLSQGYEEIAKEIILLSIRKQWKDHYTNTEINNKIKALKNENSPLAWRKW